MFWFGILCEQKVKYKNERKMDRLWDIYSAEYYSEVKGMNSSLHTTIWMKLQRNAEIKGWGEAISIKCMLSNFAYVTSKW